MTQDTRARELELIRSRRTWHGYLTLENFDAIAERITALLTGSRYTFASCKERQLAPPEVRTGQQLLPEGIAVTRSVLDDGRAMAHLSAPDTYGVWGLHTVVPDQEAAWACARTEQGTRRLVRVAFSHGRHDGGRIDIEQYNGYQERLYWVIAVEPEDRHGLRLRRSRGGWQ